MTHSENSPQAQEVKAVKAWATLNVDGTLNANSIHALSQAKDDIERKGGKMIQVEIRPVTDSGSSPSAEECLEWLFINADEVRYVKHCPSGDYWVIKDDDEIGNGSTPLEAIRSAMSQQEKKI